MGNVARIILYGCLADIERYSRSDSDQGKLSVFTLATPDFYGSADEREVSGTFRSNLVIDKIGISVREGYFNNRSMSSSTDITR